MLTSRCVQVPIRGSSSLAVQRWTGGTTTVMVSVTSMTLMTMTRAPAGTTSSSVLSFANTLTMNSTSIALLQHMVTMVSTTVAVAAPWQLSPCRNRRPMNVGLMLVGTDITVNFRVIRDTKTLSGPCPLCLTKVLSLSVELSRVTSLKTR